MKDSLAPINVAVDSVAFFVGMVAWGYGVWLPLLLVLAICMVNVPVGASVLLLSLFTAVFVPLGILLKWLANGLILRKRVRTGLSILALAFLGFTTGFGPLLTKSQPALDRPDECLVGIAFLSAAAVAALGLTKRARGIDG
jgi:hypothetical protein